MQSIFLDHCNQHADTISVFTDGWKSDAGIGFGVVFPDRERRGRLSSVACIFTAELHTILKALKEILIINGNKFTLYCDSKSVLQSLEHFNPHYPLVLEIIE